MNKSSLLLTVVTVFLISCQQLSQDATVNNEDRLSTVAGSKSNRADSLEDIADRMHDEAASVKSNSITVTLDNWSADKNLNTVRRITLKNTSSKKVVGVKLVYIMPLGKGSENRNLGKFRVLLSPSKNLALKIPAKKFGVSDDIIEIDATTRLMFPDDKVVASVIYFENGEVEVHDFPIGFQHKE